MTLQKKTSNLIEQAYNILSEYNPMTLRQVYYQLVSRHVIDNKQNEYKRLSGALVRARQDGTIPWAWVEDRVRSPRVASMWQDLPDFIHTVKNAYRKDVWENQDVYVELWLEKDALSGIFAGITREYGVTLVVGRGYNSWSAYKDAIDRFFHYDKTIDILYFGDFDPSGEDIVRALKDSLNFFGLSPEIEKIALTKQDVIDYDLPPDFTKKTDSRSAKFVKKYGDIAVELDALSLPVLQEKIRESIEDRLNMDALRKTKSVEVKERAELASKFN